MEAVVFFEFASEASGVRSGLLDRIGPIALSGDGRLNFVGTERDERGRPVSEVIALGFKSAETAQAVMLRWRGDPAFPAGVKTRLMRIEPIWSIEPLAMMFP
ncbi:hypothetical protein [Bosea sp. 685]|uniref:hypothetical protein n=1 Tax=Bosea sp. 685 TaxID=3080057 RepID=UPI002892A273|nr:hypothetical protein [Bosea sp. 685]WNJ93204.1 hypothetical protein RMR04_13305 [Bosea sp. 685]